jgi:hypothetical protein
MKCYESAWIFMKFHKKKIRQMFITFHETKFKFKLQMEIKVHENFHEVS